MTTNKVSDSAVERKKRSEVVLRQEGVPYIAHLPVIEDEGRAKRRSKKDVADRAMALCLVAVKGEGMEQEYVLRIMREYGLESFLTPKEKAFVFDHDPSQQDRINFSWRYEAYWVLLWALGYIEQLERPDHICDVPRAVKIMRDRTAHEFVEGAQLRSLAEILDQADLVYRYHWAVVNARIAGQDPPANLDPGVVYERHYALNWLIGYMDQEWDDVTTDT